MEQPDRPLCPKCHNEMTYELHRKGAATEYRRWRCGRCRSLSAAHKMTANDYLSLAEQQGGGCAICGAVEALVIDHDHSCCPAGKSCPECRRGLLCHTCNRALGLMRDDVLILSSAMTYLLAASRHRLAGTPSAGDGGGGGIDSVPPSSSL